MVYTECVHLVDETVVWFQGELLAPYLMADKGGSDYIDYIATNDKIEILDLHI